MLCECQPLSLMSSCLPVRPLFYFTATPYLAYVTITLLCLPAWCCDAPSPPAWLVWSPSTLKNLLTQGSDPSAQCDPLHVLVSDQFSDTPPPSLHHTHTYLMDYLYECLFHIGPCGDFASFSSSVNSGCVGEMALSPQHTNTGRKQEAIWICLPSRSQVGLPS